MVKPDAAGPEQDGVAVRMSERETQSHTCDVEITRPDIPVRTTKSRQRETTEGVSIALRI
jgi:hypothetical protein